MTEKMLFRSKLLDSLDDVIYGYSSRGDGDMRQENARDTFASTLGLDGSALMKPKQVHGNVIFSVPGTMTTRVVPSVDGLVSRGIPLSVISADCAPLLAVDSKHGVIGVAHAGWKGTLSGIASNLVRAMCDLGADAKDICVAIGPRIDIDNYSVPEERAEVFEKKFGKRSGVVKKEGTQWYLDIGRANQILLQESGIGKDHIDMLPYSTYAMPDVLYSYRKDTDDSYGEIVGVIGIKK